MKDEQGHEKKYHWNHLLFVTSLGSDNDAKPQTDDALEFQLAILQWCKSSGILTIMKRVSFDWKCIISISIHGKPLQTVI